MGEIRDMMGTFELYQPMELDGALDLLSSHGSDAWILSGGLDTFDWLKDRAKNPGVVVDVGEIEELSGVVASGDGIRIGAMTRLDEVVRHPESGRASRCWRMRPCGWRRRRSVIRGRSAGM